MARLLGVAASTIGAHELSAAFLDHSISELRAQGRLGVLAQSLTSQMLNQLLGGDWPSAMLVAEECERLTRETQQPRWQSAALSILAALAGLRGGREPGAGAGPLRASGCWAASRSPPTSPRPSTPGA
ncbi:hypothetical protein GCM10020220_071390 [Nonomuraea rubra]|uniref:hypothetical protein n=1 Tax=Nonomuraea rubra TaxID=46180 RepID=UPI0031E6A653